MTTQSHTHTQQTPASPQHWCKNTEDGVDSLLHLAGINSLFNPARWSLVQMSFSCSILPSDVTVPPYDRYLSPLLTWIKQLSSSLLIVSH